MTKEDELAARRAAGEQDDDGGEGKTLEQLEAEGAERIAEEDDGQMFVWEQGRKVTLGTLIARGTTVEHAVVFGGKRLKGAGQLIAFDDDVLFLTRGLVSKTSLVPTRDDDERVTKVTVEVKIAAKSVVNANSDEAESLLGGTLEARGWTPPSRLTAAA